jgi:hypothetical protein
VSDIQWHAIYKEDDQVKDCEFNAPASFDIAEREFRKLVPNATYWELGMPMSVLTGLE